MSHRSPLLPHLTMAQQVQNEILKEMRPAPSDLLSKMMYGGVSGSVCSSTSIPLNSPHPRPSFIPLGVNSEDEEDVTNCAAAPEPHAIKPQGRGVARSSGTFASSNHDEMSLTKDDGANAVQTTVDGDESDFSDDGWGEQRSAKGFVRVTAAQIEPKPVLRNTPDVKSKPLVSPCSTSPSARSVPSSSSSSDATVPQDVKDQFDVGKKDEYEDKRGDMIAGHVHISSSGKADDDDHIEEALVDELKRKRALKKVLRSVRDGPLLKWGEIADDEQLKEIVLANMDSFVFDHDSTELRLSAGLPIQNEKHLRIENFATSRDLAILQPDGLPAFSLAIPLTFVSPCSLVAIHTTMEAATNADFVDKAVVKFLAEHGKLEPVAQLFYGSVGVMKAEDGQWYRVVVVRREQLEADTWSVLGLDSIIGDDVNPSVVVEASSLFDLPSTVGLPVRPPSLFLSQIRALASLRPGTLPIARLSLQADVYARLAGQQTCVMTRCHEEVREKSVIDLVHILSVDDPSVNVLVSDILICAGLQEDDCEELTVYPVVESMKHPVWVLPSQMPPRPDLAAALDYGLKQHAAHQDELNASQELGSEEEIIDSELPDGAEIAGPKNQEDDDIIGIAVADHQENHKPDVDVLSDDGWDIQRKDTAGDKITNVVVEEELENSEKRKQCDEMEKQQALSEARLIVEQMLNNDEKKRMEAEKRKEENAATKMQQEKEIMEEEKLRAAELKRVDVETKEQEENVMYEDRDGRKREEQSAMDALRTFCANPLKGAMLRSVINAANTIQPQPANSLNLLFRHLGI